MHNRPTRQWNPTLDINVFYAILITMATIRELAQYVGVSIATVSKVLNNQNGVSKETEALVLQAAKKLNYRPNLNARHLKTGTSKTLGIIAEDLTVFNTPDIIDGIGVCCESRSFHYILGNLRFDKRFGHETGNAEQKNRLVLDMMDQMLSKQVDGIIYIGCHSHALAMLSRSEDTRFVCAYCYSEDPSIPAVIYDDRQAARRVTDLLLSKGHAKIGIVAGTKDSFHTNNRLLGIQESLYEHSVPYNPHFICHGDWTRDLGYRCAPVLLERGVTAIFAMNDLMAMGVLDYCNHNHIEVGRDLALIGFDNREISSVSRPALSTVALPLFEIGHTAASIMLDMIEKEGVAQPSRILLDCAIIERESTGFPSAN